MAPNIVSPKALLERFGLRPKRSFGQNFLADTHIAQQIALHCGVEGGTAVEIGAGLGALTAPLLERAAHVIAIERDRDLLPPLRELFADALAKHRLSLEEKDAQQCDYPALLRGHPEPHVLCGNLPYQLTGVLLRRFVELAGAVERVTLLVQLEVADRLVAAPSTEAYGALSVFVQARCEPVRALVVRRGAFYPQPQVDSAVVVLKPRAQPLAAETEVFRALVHTAFQQRRKKLRNAWQGVGKSAEELTRAAERAGIDLDSRGETLGAADFGRMARELEP
jgi:16S rRNA (adenine1518-N6/adenine1519-N6)-dimethyltransferase